MYHFKEVVYVAAGSKKLGKNFRKMIPIYELFGSPYNDLDWSDASLLELYEYESTGKGSVNPKNGFAHGKKIMDITVANWKEDMFVTLFPNELYEDDRIPNWWLDKVLKEFQWNRNK